MCNKMIKDVSISGNTLKFKIESKDENAMMALKTYLNNDDDVEIAGMYKEHYLVGDFEFIVRVKSGDVKKIITKVVDFAIKDLKSKLIK